MNNYILVMDPIYGPHLEHKTHKYIKRWWENGKWHYTYRNTGKSNAEKYLETYNRSRNQDYYSQYQQIHKLGERKQQLENENNELRNRIARNTTKSVKNNDSSYLKQVKEDTKTINKNSKAIKDIPKTQETIYTSIYEQKQKNKNYGKEAMIARNKYHMENARTASAARNRKLSTILKKSVKEAITTKSIKKGMQMLSSLLKNRDK